MAYRDEEAADALEAPTADGPLRVMLGPGRATLTLPDRSLVIGERVATLTDGKKRKTFDVRGPLVVARGVPREDFGVWIVEAPLARRVLGIEPVPLLDEAGLPALKKLDSVYQRLRASLSELARGVTRAVEIGSGHPLDKVLLCDHGDRFDIYARSLFHQAAEYILGVSADGRVDIPSQPKLAVSVHSRFGVTVRGDYIRFSDPRGIDQARVAIPWIGPEDREELARRIGQLVDR
ncbi:MAG: hypothetical protein ACM31C_23635 [Acidobacteriota bacterium]